MWRGLTDRWVLVSAIGVAAVCAAGNLNHAAAAPYDYSFGPVPGPEEPVKPQPAIDAHYSPAYRVCRDDPHATTYSLDMCDKAEMARQDDALNRQWARTLTHLPPARIAGLRAAERTWVKGRKQHCDAASNLYAGGTIMPLVYGSCYVDETIRRSIWLEKLR